MSFSTPSRRNSRTHYRSNSSSLNADSKIKNQGNKYFETHGTELSDIKIISGIAIITLDDGSIYEGDILDGKPNGDGTCTWDGKTYTGRFKNGMFHGKGTFIEPDVGQYVGEFEEGIFHGEGTYIWNDGTIYNGLFQYGLRQEGHGKLYNKSNELIRNNQSIEFLDWDVRSLIYEYTIDQITYSELRATSKQFAREAMLSRINYKILQLSYSQLLHYIEKIANKVCMPTSPHSHLEEYKTYARYLACQRKLRMENLEDFINAQLKTTGLTFNESLHLFQDIQHHIDPSKYTQHDWEIFIELNGNLNSVWQNTEREWLGSSTVIRTPLCIATMENKVEVVSLLLKYLTKIKTTFNNWNSTATPLTIAAHYGFTEICKLLLVNKTDPNIEEALSEAAVNGHIEIVLALIEAGANFKTSTVHNAPFIDWAFYKGHLKVILALINTPADLKDLKIDCHPNYDVENYQDIITEGALALIKAGAHYKNLTVYRGDFISWAAGNLNSESILTIIDPLINAGVNFNEIELMLTHNNVLKNLQGILALIRAGIDLKNITVDYWVRSQDRQQQPILQWAASTGQIEIILALMEIGADFRTLEIKLHSHSVLRNLPEVLALIRAGNDLKNIIVDYWGCQQEQQHPLLHWASSTGQIKILLALFKIGVDFTTIQIKLNSHSALSNLPEVLALIRSGIDLKNITVDYRVRSQEQQVSISQWAALHGKIEILLALIEAGADCKNLKIDYRPDRFAVGDYRAIIKEGILTLLKAGSNFKNVTVYGESAIAWLASQGEIKVLLALKDSGVDFKEIELKLPEFDLKNLRGVILDLIQAGFDPKNIFIVRNIGAEQIQKQPVLDWALLRRDIEILVAIAETGSDFRMIEIKLPEYKILESLQKVLALIRAGINPENIIVDYSIGQQYYQRQQQRHPILQWAASRRRDDIVHAVNNLCK